MQASQVILFALLIAFAIQISDAYTHVCSDRCYTPGGSECSNSVTNCINCIAGMGIAACGPPPGQSQTNATGPIDRCGAPCWGNQYCSNPVYVGNICNQYCLPPPLGGQNGICVQGPPPHRRLRVRSEDDNDRFTLPEGWSYDVIEPTRKQWKEMKRRYDADGSL